MLSRSIMWRSGPDSVDAIHSKSLMKNSHFRSSCVTGKNPKGLVCFSQSTVCKPSKIVVVVRIDWFSSFCFRVTESIDLGPNPNYTLCWQQQLHFSSFLQGRCICITHCRCYVPGFNFGFWMNLKSRHRVPLATTMGTGSLSPVSPWYWMHAF